MTVILLKSTASNCMHFWTREKSTSVAPFCTAELAVGKKKRSSRLRMQSAVVGTEKEGQNIRKKMDLSSQLPQIAD